MNDKEYENWEEQVKRAKLHNEDLLVKFEDYLFEKKLRIKTIDRHLLNIDYYANYYLLSNEIILVEDGALKISKFLGEYFIYKASWSNQYTIKQNIASLKKFYGLLVDLGVVSKEVFDQMVKIIKEEKSEWLAYRREEF